MYFMYSRIRSIWSSQQRIRQSKTSLSTFRPVMTLFMQLAFAEAMSSFIGEFSIVFLTYLICIIDGRGITTLTDAPYRCYIAMPNVSKSHIITLASKLVTVKHFSEPDISKILHWEFEFRTFLYRNEIIHHFHIKQNSAVCQKCFWSFLVYISICVPKNVNKPLGLPSCCQAFFRTWICKTKDLKFKLLA